MTNICVIGGNGFVGTNLLNRLKNNDDNEIICMYVYMYTMYMYIYI